VTGSSVDSVPEMSVGSAVPKTPSRPSDVTGGSGGSEVLSPSRTPIVSEPLPSGFDSGFSSSSGRSSGRSGGSSSSGSSVAPSDPSIPSDPSSSDPSIPSSPTRPSNPSKPGASSFFSGFDEITPSPLSKPPRVPTDEGGQDLFFPEVKRKGRFERVGQGFKDPFEAATAGFEIVSRTPSATGRVVNRAGIPIPTQLPSGSIESFGDELGFVEPSSKRIDTTGELFGITFKGVEASQKKSRKSKKRGRKR